MYVSQLEIVILSINAYHKNKLHKYHCQLAKHGHSNKVEAQFKLYMCYIYMYNIIVVVQLCYTNEEICT